MTYSLNTCGNDMLRPFLNDFFGASDNLTSENYGRLAMKTDIRVLTPPLGVKEQSSPVKKNVIFGAFLLGLFLPACTIFVRERNRKQ